MSRRWNATSSRESGLRPMYYTATTRSDFAWLLLVRCSSSPLPRSPQHQLIRNQHEVHGDQRHPRDHPDTTNQIDHPAFDTIGVVAEAATAAAERRFSRLLQVRAAPADAREEAVFG